jgi:hypothetical protein
MADANPHPTPLPAGADEHLVKYTVLATQADIKHYQSLIGSLLYVQIGTRPDTVGSKTLAMFWVFRKIVI